MEISQELVERMAALVRAVADVPKDSALGQSGYASEARAIVAELPKPVDPDLIEAEAIFGKWQGGDQKMIDMVLSAIRRGRELERAK